MNQRRTSLARSSGVLPVDMAANSLGSLVSAVHCLSEAIYSGCSHQYADGYYVSICGDTDVKLTHQETQ